MKLIHEFFVIPAKYIFLNANGYVTVYPDGLRIADARKQGLSPVLLYGLVHEGAGLTYFQAVAWDAPTSIREFLVNAWSRVFASLPDEVVIGTRFESRLPDLFDFLREQGVQPVIASGTNKRYASYQRSAQMETRYVAGWFKSTVTLSEFNAKAARSFQTQCSLFASRTEKAKEYQAYQEYLATRRRGLAVPPGPYTVEIQPGDWLLTNQSSIPPVRSADNAGRAVAPSLVFYAQEEVKCLVPFWPAPRHEMLQDLEMTGAMFNWYLTLKRGITDDQVESLMYHFQMQWYSGGMDGEYFPEPRASYVLVAKDSATPSQFHALHEFLTHGGDVGLGFEVLPLSQRADPSWRFYLDGRMPQWFLIALPRGSRVATVLDVPLEAKGAVFNGTHARTVPDKFYQALAALLPAAAEFNRNGPSQLEFQEQWYGVIDELERVAARY